ncbi:MAG: HNH endonuclease, partial [Myxococcales bacterium]|nr:HNH endonuclease [Myxococcales bacterium]
VDERLYMALGYAHVGHYAQEVLDLSPRKTRDLLHVARCLPHLPALDAAFAEGRIGWTKARELIRVVVPETEVAWVARAEEVTSRVLEAEVSAAKVGDGPPSGAPVTRAAARVRMVFELDAAEAEVVRDALAWIAATSGEERLDRGAALAAMAQRILHDAEDDAPTGERHRIVLTACPTCATVDAPHAEASETLVQEAQCCGDTLDMRPGPTRGHVSRTIPPATRRAVEQRDGRRCVVPGCTCRLWVDLHHVAPWSRGGGHEESNLVTLCTVHHRLVHDGVLAVERVEGRVVVTGPAG